MLSGERPQTLVILVHLRGYNQQSTATNAPGGWVDHSEESEGLGLHVYV
jgi:8-oxo-dGTP pyrophosphatase MutT (NUDIX family)